MTKEIIIEAVGVIAGAGYVLVSSHVTWMHQPTSRLVLLAFAVFVPMVITLSKLSHRQVRWTIAFLLIGIIGGVLVDVVADPKPRNLFPLDMVAWCAVIAPALAVGATGAYLLRRKRVTAQQE
jgi:lipopolysaccharide export LptBFGC system permease protein LptF